MILASLQLTMNGQRHMPLYKRGIKYWVNMDLRCEVLINQKQYNGAFKDPHGSMNLTIRFHNDTYPNSTWFKSFFNALPKIKAHINNKTSDAPDEIVFEVSYVEGSNLHSISFSPAGTVTPLRI